MNKNFFLEQWERVQRWADRCFELKSMQRVGPDLLDFYYAFFINAYHLKDWMEEWLDLNNRACLKKQLKKDFDQNVHLRLLKDICNGAKHFTLDRPKEAETFSPLLEYGNDNYTFLIGHHRLDPDDLVLQVLMYWSTFIKDNGLDNLKNQFDSSKGFTSSDKIKK